jgi:tetratricopeptide (TPR) repeat protein
MAEQLFLFEDRLTLLNRGLLDFTRLNLEEAKAAFERHKALYPSEADVDTKLKLTDFLIRGLAGAPSDCPEGPAYLCDLWHGFEDFRRSVGFNRKNVVSEAKLSFFRRTVEAIDKCNMADIPFLSEKIPTGYVYIQTGQYDKAIRALQACVPVKPHNAAIYGYLGDAYTLRGEPHVARQCYLEACLIDPQSIDWDHMKDHALLELKDAIGQHLFTDNALALEWLPSHAYIQSLFKPKTMRLNEGIKEFVDEYLALQKASFKDKGPELKAKLFFRGIILCDNEPLLRFVKRVNFIDVRRQMKDANPALFSKYLKRVDRTKRR